MELKDLKKVRFTIDPNNMLSGIKVMSLVEEPAIESNFQYFSKPKPKFQKFESGKYKQVVHGLALRANFPILRYDEFGEQYAGYFLPEDVAMLHNKFHKDGNGNKVNLQHDSKQYVDAYLISSYLVESDFMVQHLKSVGIESVIGDWYTSYQIEDPEVFNKVVNGELKGFSIEAFLDQLFSKTNNNSKNKSNSVMNIFRKIRAEIDSLLLESFSTTDASGVEYEYYKVGEPLQKVVKNADGESIYEVAPDGVYALQDGKEVTQSKGSIVSIRIISADSVDAPKEAPVEAPVEQKESMEAKAFQRSKADGIEYEYTVVGEAVSLITIAEDGSEKKEPVADGTFKLENGDSVTVVSGVATEIVKAEEPAAEIPAEQAAAEVKFAVVNAELETAKTENLAKANMIEKLNKQVKEMIEKISKLEKMSIIENPVIVPLKKESKELGYEELKKMSASERWKYKNDMAN